MFDLYMITGYDEKEYSGSFETYDEANNEAIDLHMSYPMDFYSWEIVETDE